MKTKKNGTAETEGLGIDAMINQLDEQSTDEHLRACRVWDAGIALLSGGFTDWPNLRTQAETCVDMLTAPTADEGTTINDADVEYLSDVGAGDEASTETSTETA